MMAADQTRNPGRYGTARMAVMPPDPLPARGRDGKRQVVHGHVDNPAGDRTKPQRVAINAHTDLLETEHAYGRLTPAQYAAARAYQAVLELASGARTGGSALEPADGGSSITAHEAAIVLGLERARRAVLVQEGVRRAIGGNRAACLVMVLREGAGSRELAVWLGVEPTAHHRRHAVEFFRQSVAALELELGRIPELNGRA